ncbi:ADP-ribosylation factor-binding protein GGA1 isoform X2 [Bacillus rossius redtenbacheri]|uniref:ADP-ribosylation factor-binding protein GGA1 isoform X2 n=1 Tax=Bacillus rossius redtenbacheri TaxID=93214 RepID=UPI002FDD8262
MDDRTLTVESLISRATNPRNHVTDFAAVVELCNLLLKEPPCCHAATRALAARIQSQLEWEALQALNLLDTCMKQCGAAFHAEVGKFRFLNEMIKLVSPKYLGGRTPPPVRQRVLGLMLAWTSEYPREPKIKEAYDMLRKQGVIRELPPPTAASAGEVPTPPPPRPRSTIFEDEEKSRLLQRLLQSKNPEDLQAANRLIKTMVKEDERRVEINSRRVTELESVHNNARLLGEMLDSYRPGQTPAEDLELIRELHQSCERLRPSVFRLASEAQEDDAMLGEVLNASDELTQVFEKYTDVMVKGKTLQGPSSLPGRASPSLLDLSTPSEEKLPPVPEALLTSQMAHLGLESTASQPAGKVGVSSAQSPGRQSNFDALGDIFNSIAPIPTAATASVDLVRAQPILQPIPLQQQGTAKGANSTLPQESLEKTSKLKALEDLDALGESLLKQSLPASCKTGVQFTKSSRVPMNLLTRGPEVTTGSPNSFGPPPATAAGKREPAAALDLDFLAGDGGGGGGGGGGAKGGGAPDLLNGDDVMVDLSEEAEPKSGDSAVNGVVAAAAPPPGGRPEVKPIADLFVPLESIRPGEVQPLTVLEEKNGISVILHFGKERPRPDVSVIVVTTLSKNASRLSNYLFQAVVPKSCKLRLQPPSGSDLPAFNPFLPPAAITQVMLIANPSKVGVRCEVRGASNWCRSVSLVSKDPVSLKFILSYTMEDEMMTEMGEVERLPLDA